MFDLGMGEITLILVVAVVVFGPEKLPEVSRALGKGVREFRKALRDVEKAADQDAAAGEERDKSHGKQDG